MGMPSMFSRLTGGLRALLSKTRAEQELADELREYEQAIVDENLAKGMSRDAAVRAARVEIGSVEAVKDRVRDAGWESVVESVWQDVRVSFRLLRKQPGVHRRRRRHARHRHRRHDRHLQRRRCVVPQGAGRRGRRRISAKAVHQARRGADDDADRRAGLVGRLRRDARQRSDACRRRGVPASRARGPRAWFCSRTGVRQRRLPRLPHRPRRASCCRPPVRRRRRWGARRASVRRGQPLVVAIAIRRRHRHRRQDPAREWRAARDRRRHRGRVHRHRDERRRRLAGLVHGRTAQPDGQ